MNTWRVHELLNVGGRSQQEDSTLLLNLPGDGLLLVVADGMGGHDGGADASAAACEAIKTFMLEVYAADDGATPRALAEDFSRDEVSKHPEECMRRVLSQAMEAAQEAVAALGTGRRAPGTTCTVFWAFSPTRLGVAHVGDSYLFRRTPGSDWEQMTERHGVRHLVTLALSGSDFWPDIERQMTLGTWEAVEGQEMWLLASDGLCPGEGDDAIPPRPHRGEHGQAFLERLFKRSRDMGCSDNAAGILAWWAP